MRCDFVVVLVRMRYLGVRIKRDHSEGSFEAPPIDHSTSIVRRS